MESTHPPASPAPPVEGRPSYLSRTGHELRNPLSNILALAEGLQDGIYGDISVRQADAVRSVTENAHRILQLVNAFLDSEKIVAGSVVLAPAASSLDDILQEALGSITSAAAVKSLQVPAPSAYRATPPGLTAHADAKRLGQVVAEMLGCVLVSVPAKGQIHLETAASVADGELEVVVWGGSSATTCTPAERAGPSPLVLERLRKLKGIGLALAERILELHRGSLSVHELTGNGLCLVAKIPMTLSGEPLQAAPVDTDQDSTSNPSAGAAGEGSTSTDAEPPLLLLADDEAVLRNITHDYLESIGYRVIAAVDGKEAAELAAREHPDLIIMDVLMPIMDGIEAMQKIRGSADARLAVTPIISMSGLAVPADRERCLKAGASTCLVKPFGIKQLEQAIHDCLGSRAMHAGA